VSLPEPTEAERDAMETNNERHERGWMDCFNHHLIEPYSDHVEGMLEAAFRNGFQRAAGEE
jgi:hypothetical protein